MYDYLEDYWIQPSITKDIHGDFSNDGRVRVVLYKFNVQNDWALFQRADGLVFDDKDVATIETNADSAVLFQKLAILHCPVSLASSIGKVSEFSVGCNYSGVHIQSFSSHHIKYEGRDLVKGSSGGAVFVKPSLLLLGMHIETINENEYNESESGLTMTATSKRVDSEDFPYGSIESVKKKAKLSDSETVASMVEGANGIGSAIIICKFNRLMYYIAECEK